MSSDNCLGSYTHRGFQVKHSSKVRNPFSGSGAEPSIMHMDMQEELLSRRATCSIAIAAPAK